MTLASLAQDREEFAAARRKLLTDNDTIVLAAARRAVANHGAVGWTEPILEAAQRVFTRVLRQESGITRHSHLDRVLHEFRHELAHNLAMTGVPGPGTAETLARWVTTAAVNAATVFATEAQQPAGETLGKEWITMHDMHVRDKHVKVDGQTVPVHSKFRVGGYKLDYPGQPVGPPEVWINCRCVARPSKLGASEGGTMTAATDESTAVDQPVDQQDQDGEWEFQPVPWHGVLAPEGVTSGDKRRFSAGALSWRDLPLPLAWQKISDEKHKGSVIVGQINKIWRSNGLLKAAGHWDQSADADEAFRLVVDGMLRGVSVDVDDVTMEFQAENGTPVQDGADGIATFTKGRICGATLVAIPAFQEAFVAVGDGVTAAGVVDKPWNGDAGRFTPEQYYRSTVLHRNGRSMNKSDNSLPIREPDGTLNRNAVHAAAAALRGARGGVKNASSSAISAAKSAIRAAYRQLGEDPPEGFGVGQWLDWEDQEAFARGPGWVTNPAGTRRLWNYWVHGPGAAKIRWGEPRDFYRCRDQVGQEIGESSPAKLRFINQICAQWHHDAIGMWPGQEDKHGGQVETLDGEAAPAVLVASAVPTATRRAEFFADPNLMMPSPLVVTSDGHVFGHLATWGTCHIGIGNACVTAPQSKTNYSYFHTGSVELDDGTSLAVGHITLGGGHADRFAGYRAASSHYDDVGTCVADVRAGEDQYGIWVSGQVREGITSEQLTALRAAALSGDWRPIGNGLELVAALCVNVPGFPIPRTEMSVSEGAQRSLVAAGVVQQATGTADTAQLAAAVADEIERRGARRRMQQLRAQANRDRMARLRS